MGIDAYIIFQMVIGALTESVFCLWTRDTNNLKIVI